MSQCQLVKRFVNSRCRTVYQAVEPSLQASHTLLHTIQALVEGQVCSAEGEREMLLLRLLVQSICSFLPSYIVSDDAGASAGKLERNGFPDSSRASGDQETLARK